LNIGYLPSGILTLLFFDILPVEDLGENRIRCWEYTLKKSYSNNLLHLKSLSVPIDLCCNISSISSSSHCIKLQTRSRERPNSSKRLLINCPICMFFKSTLTLFLT